MDDREHSAPDSVAATATAMDDRERSAPDSVAATATAMDDRERSASDSRANNKPKNTSVALLHRGGGLLSAFGDLQLLDLLAYLELHDLSSCAATSFKPFRPSKTDRWESVALERLRKKITRLERELMHDEYEMFDEHGWDERRDVYTDLFVALFKVDNLTKLSAGKGSVPDATTVISVPRAHAHDELELRSKAESFVNHCWLDDIVETANEFGPAVTEFSIIEQARLECLSVRGPLFIQPSDFACAGSGVMNDGYPTDWGRSPADYNRSKLVSPLFSPRPPPPFKSCHQLERLSHSLHFRRNPFSSVVSS